MKEKKKVTLYKVPEVSDFKDGFVFEQKCESKKGINWSKRSVVNENAVMPDLIKRQITANKLRVLREVIEVTDEQYILVVDMVSKPLELVGKIRNPVELSEALDIARNGNMTMLYKEAVDTLKSEIYV
jgi:hypothetical protein